MKRIFCLVLLGALLVLPAAAGLLNVSGRGGLYTSPSGGSSSMMYGLSASYPLNEHLFLRGSVDTTTYTANNVQSTYTPVCLRLIYNQELTPNLNAYGGAGASYNSTTSGGTTTSTAGGQAEVGLRFSLAGMDAGVEWRWQIPDLNHTDKWSTYSNAYITGGFSQSFNI